MSKKLTTEEFIEKARKVHGDKYDYSNVEYINAKTKVEIICSIHGIFWQNPHDHLNKAGCSYCANEHRNDNSRLTTKEFIKRAKEVHGDKYDYSNAEYKGANIKLKIICPAHGIFEQTPSKHLNRKHGCPICSGQYMDTNLFVQKARKVHGDKYDYSNTNYFNTNTKVKIICPIHGTFEQIPSDHLQSKGCPRCKSSKGEAEIRNYLKEQNIIFEEQKKFKDCKDERQLPYDFYVPEKRMLIEYQGNQHYYNSFRKELHDWHRYKHHDWLKRKYAKGNNYQLLTISYKDDILTKLKEIL